MTRIPSNLVEKIKREIPIEALVLAAGIELKRVGENLAGRCNRHDDKTPSLIVTPEKNLFHCMGACQRGGSVIDWVMWQRDLGFNEAVRVLLEKHAPDEAKRLSEPRPPKKREKAELPCPLSSDAEGATLAREVIDYYHAKGKVSREFSEYLEKRGLNDEELVEAFKLGYADRTLGMTLTLARRKRVQEIGFFRATGHEHFNGSLVIPVLGENGEVLGCYGRKVRSDLRPGTPDHLYLTGPHRGVFNLAAFKASSEIILCESLIDALSFWRHGMRNVTAAYGVEGFTEELLDAFVSHGIERVFIAFDRDEAGDRGAEKVAKKLSAAGIACFRVLFPKGMDANDVSLKMHPARKTFELFLRSAEWMCGGSSEKKPLAPPVVASPASLVTGSSSKPRNGEAVAGSVLASAESLLPLAARSLPVLTPDTSSLAASGMPASEVLAEDADGPADLSGSEGTTKDEEPNEERQNLESSVPAVPKTMAAAKRGRDAAGEPGGEAGQVAKEGSIREAAKRGISALTPPLGTTPAATAPPASTVTLPSPAASKPAPPITGAPSRAGDPLLSLTEDEAVFLFGDRRYRVRGLRRNTAFDVLKLNIMATREGVDFEGTPLSGFHADTFDLYLARFRQLFEKQASQELGVKDEVVKRDLAAMLKKLEEIQTEAIRKAHEPKVKTVLLGEEETAEALEFWRSPNLFERIVSDITKCGLVGEPVNKLVCYIAAVSRLLERPLAVIIQSNSAAGKSALMEAILLLMPEESREKYTAVSGKSLFYFDENTALSHKILAIVEEEGAEKATYPLKLLQSEGELVMASTGKDPHTGKLVTQTYKVTGPVMIILTTTAIELDPELENRCLRLTVDESREQTRLIHELQRQRQTLEALTAKKEKARIQKIHQNAQRLLRPVTVLNPFVHELTFVDDQTRTRRDHDKYLTLIEAVTLMHQHQRPVRHVRIEGESVECVEVTLDDIETANRLAGEILGRTLDELPPQTRRFLNLLHEKVKAVCDENAVETRDFRFSRRDARGWLGWGNTQVFIHLGRLIEFEYVLVHRGERGQSFVYELVYRGEGDEGQRFVLGLVDVEKIRKRRRGETREAEYDRQRSDSAPASSESGETDSGRIRPRFGGDSLPVREAESTHEPASEEALPAIEPKSAEISLLPARPRTRSYRLRPFRSGVKLNLLHFPPAPSRCTAVASPSSHLAEAAG